MAITGVTYEPQDYRTAYNPVEYVLTSNQTAQPRFKYVIEVYDGATLLGTLRVPADPNNVSCFPEKIGKYTNSTDAVILLYFH